MTTLALLGLLVVLLVAIGIAAFLFRGRKRDDETDVPAAEPTGPPRTVRDLVDRRRGPAEDTTGDGEATGDTPDAADPAASGTAATGAAAETRTADDEPVGGPGSEPDEHDVAEADTDTDTDATPATVSAESSVVAEPDAGAVGDRDTPAPGATADTGTTSDEDSAASVPRPGRDLSDVDSGPVGPPWSRGFVDGRPIEPPPPASAPHPRPTPHARTPRTVTSASDGSGTAAVGAAAAGAAVAGTAAAGTAANQKDTDKDTETTEDVAATPTTSAAGASSGESVAPRPAAPPRQESRSPVDPDLVKRVTAVPNDRSAIFRTTTPDTEREFREARDRITGPTATGRVPEQGGPVGATASRRPSPVPVPDRDGPDEPDRAENDTSTGSSVATGAGIVAGTLGLGAVATGLAASRGTGASTEDTASGGGSSTATGADITVPDTSGSDTSGADTSAAAEPSAPAPRAAAAGGPPFGPTGEPAPRPTPRLMRSSTPVTGADEDTDEDPDSGTSVTDAGTAPVTDTAPVTQAASATEAVTDADAVADTDTAPQTPAGIPAVEAGTTPIPAAPEDDESSPVVAFRRSGPAAEPATPVSGTARQDVEVLVAGRDEAPVDGVAVAVLDGTGREIGTGTTDARGAATLRVPGAGRYVVVSSAEGYQPGVATCAVADDPARVSLTVTRSAAVHGVVRTATGTAMAGVAVTLEQDGDTVGRADTGADGAFRIADLGAGYYLLAAGTGAGAASQSLRVVAEADVEQDLRIAR